MAKYPHEVDWKFNFDISGTDIFTGNSAHAFAEAERGSKYRNRAITIKNGKAVLAGDNDRVIGSFLYFDSGKAVVRIASAGTRYKNSGVTALSTGEKIIGATRIISPGGVSENGFVKEAVLGATYNAAVIAHIEGSSGYITGGGGAYAADTDPIADVIVLQSMGS